MSLNYRENWLKVISFITPALPRGHFGGVGIMGSSRRGPILSQHYSGSLALYSRGVGARDISSSGFQAVWSDLYRIVPNRRCGCRMQETSL